MCMRMQVLVCKMIVLLTYFAYLHDISAALMPYCSAAFPIVHHKRPDPVASFFAVEASLLSPICADLNFA